MKFYELSQEVQDRVVEREVDMRTSNLDWLEDLYPIINEKINEEYGLVFEDGFDVNMCVQEFELEARNIVWSTWTTLDKYFLADHFGLNGDLSEVELPVSPRGKVRLTINDYETEGFEEFESDCTRLLAEIKDSILQIVDYYYYLMTDYSYVANSLWEEEYTVDGNFM